MPNAQSDDFSLAFFFEPTSALKSPPRRKILPLTPLQTSTAKKIVKVVEALERVDEEGKEDPDFETVKEILNELLEKKDNLRSYDRSVMWNYWGYVYWSILDNV